MRHKKSKKGAVFVARFFWFSPLESLREIIEKLKNHTLHVILKKNSTSRTVIRYHCWSTERIFHLFFVIFHALTLTKPRIWGWTSKVQKTRNACSKTSALATIAFLLDDLDLFSKHKATILSAANLHFLYNIDITQ